MHTFIVIVQSDRKADKSRWLTINGRGNVRSHTVFEAAQEEADYNNQVYLKLRGIDWRDVPIEQRPYQVCEVDLD